ncbi:4096_t:CDS:2 [Paraglomus brasilianum]|uniref:4096_t:CDS:1 n=1 Tax=Paraglomus brasilianum TaxID=144538 RepID=A0A9N9CAT5_9GLOM|nr:4096_t:CDS:2 [Paraglomus brasilianum]
MEAKLREATNNEPWGLNVGDCPGNLQLASSSCLSLTCGRREQWCRNALDQIVLLMTFALIWDYAYIDEKGKDQEINGICGPVYTPT